MFRQAFATLLDVYAIFRGKIARFKAEIKCSCLHICDSLFDDIIAVLYALLAVA